MGRVYLPILAFFSVFDPEPWSIEILLKTLKMRKNRKKKCNKNEFEIPLKGRKIKICKFSIY